MGQSTNAVLFYGYCWEEEFDLPEELDEKFYLADKEPVAIGHHCSGDYPMPYLYIPESEVIAYRGYPKVVHPMPQHVDIYIKWNALLDDFCEEHDIKSLQDRPQWWLVSYWSQ